MLALALKILVAVAALGFGVWLGLPGRYETDLDSLERDMESGVGRSRKVRRHFTPLAWVQRQLSSRGGGAQRRRGFHIEAPEDRKPKGRS